MQDIPDPGAPFSQYWGGLGSWSHRITSARILLRVPSTLQRSLIRRKNSVSSVVSFRAWSDNLFQCIFWIKTIQISRYAYSRGRRDKTFIGVWNFCSMRLEGYLKFSIGGRGFSAKRRYNLYRYPQLCIPYYEAIELFSQYPHRNHRHCKGA